MSACVLESKNWYDEKNKCYSHRMENLKFLVTLLIRKNCIWLKEKIIKISKTKIDSDKTKKKIKIIQK